MAQQSLTQRLKKIRERCLNVPGGIKGVAERMGRVENTLHNWFKGRTTPTVADVEQLIEQLEVLEKQALEIEKANQRRLNAALA
ncbi:helix-turn-helix transcriptional regulator [Spirosoma sp. BT702]|uniref:Helix-turn-helix transcriptional regulator n=1 Tax=Spirosoma profusum TaxID=2771354 RepID=A0A926XX53_9BACT|nr:helix-turn-helix transcriptional regulator [Spirosoma profusum]MBD2702307.1 helix-turn-helix transcriptional regulator [Spirosoma profusum]